MGTMKGIAYAIRNKWDVGQETAERLARFVAKVRLGDEIEDALYPLLSEGDIETTMIALDKVIYDLTNARLQLREAFLPARRKTGNDRTDYDMTRDDYAFRPVNDGQRGHIACWNGQKPQPGDHLILRNDGRTTRYRVVSVDPCRNVDPPTMWMADLVFAPRTEGGHSEPADHNDK